MATFRGRRLTLALKRAIDLIGALALMILTAPLLFLAMVLVWAGLGRPVIFAQERSGYGGRTFTLYKLRTMTDARDDRGCLLSEENRVCPLGLLLRRFSVDELPQLWNVLKGDMSLIGPRPLITRYLCRYSSFQMRRHLVRPGITGWAQVSGRNALTWEQRFELDVWYVDHRSFWLDCRILLKTIWKVVSAQDTLAPGSPTDSEFLPEHLTATNAMDAPLSVESRI